MKLMLNICVCAHMCGIFTEKIKENHKKFSGNWLVKQDLP
jgi:hypothetical protein